MMKKPKFAQISEDILKDQADVDNNLYPKLGRHITLEEYIRLQSSDPKIRSGLCKEIKDIVG